MLRQKLERETLVKLFSTIPSDAIVEQQAKMKADSHKQRISETDGSRGDSSSLTTDTNSEQSDDFTTEVAGVGLGATLAARQKTMVPWKRLMLGYSASVLVFLACIATSAGIAIYSCTVDADTGRELHTAGSRVAITLYTYSLAQELIRSDPYIWEGDAGLLDLKERLRANIERV